MTRNRWAFERGILWGIDLDMPPPPVEPRLDARFQECASESTATLADAMGLRDANEVRERMASGRRCMLALVGGRIAGYGWISVRPEYIGEQEREIKLQANEAYVWDCATMPGFRGQRLYSALLSRILTVLRAQGVRRAWIGTARSNVPSLRAFATAGFQPAVTLTFARLGRFHCLRIGTPRHAPSQLTVAARRALVKSDERVWFSFAWSWSPAVPSGVRV
jgi:GNAT superfamily N-acetyltransferase